MLIDALRDPEWSVVDVGCGTGALTRRIAERFGEIVSIDIDRKRLAILRAALREAGIRNVRARRMDAHRLRFRDASFDLAVFHRSLDHIPEPRRALTEAFRVLKPDGRIYLSLPDSRDRSPAIDALDALRAFEDRLFSLSGERTDAREVAAIDLDDLRRELAAAGFSGIEEGIAPADPERARRYVASVNAKIAELLERILAKEPSLHAELPGEHERLRAIAERDGAMPRRTIELVARKAPSKF